MLVVDDEAPLRRVLEVSLTSKGYDVEIVANGDQAIAAVTATLPDLLVVDLGLPGMSGIDVIHSVRGWNPVPIIVLSARDREADKVAALDAGADDYVTKPFGIDELLARVRAALRRGQSSGVAQQIVDAGVFRVDLVRREVLRDGAAVRLTPTEWHLIEALARHPDRMVPSFQLLQEVWGPEYGEERHYLRVYMAQLRRKLEPDPSNPVALVTDPGRGYRLVTPAGERR
ncbi:MAG: response regulator transcription factor [Actinobacteria bacterium]|nr:response regulator transcription factor [Actinomycetota bacterium]